MLIQYSSPRNNLLIYFQSVEAVIIGGFFFYNVDIELQPFQLQQIKETMNTLPKEASTPHTPIRCPTNCNEEVHNVLFRIALWSFLQPLPYR